MHHASHAELSKIPYLDLSALVGGDRVVLLMPLWDGEIWRSWFDTPNGLIEFKPVDLARSNYVATNPAKESDLVFPFIHFMWQRANWPETSRLIHAICDAWTPRE